MVTRIDKYISLEKIILAVIILIGAFMIYPFFIPILVAMITAYVLLPLVNMFRKLFRSYHIALILTLSTILVPLFLILAYSANDLNPLIGEITGLSGAISNSLEFFEDYLSYYGLERFAVDVQESVADGANYVKAQMASFVFTIPMLMLHLLIYLISTYYFLKDGGNIIKFFNNYVETFEYREKRMIKSITVGLKNSFDVLFLSYITISVIVTIVAWIGFYLLGIPYPGVLALLAGIFGFLPLLGIWIVYTGAGIYEFLQGDVTTALLVISFGVIFLNIIPDLFIKPILGSKAGKVHPMTIILGFFAGPVVFGVSGFLTGPILLVIVETVVVSYMKFNIEIKKNGENIIK